MTGAIDRKEVEHFRDIVARRFGLRIDESKLGELAAVLGRRLDATHERLGSYLRRIDSPAAVQDEAPALAGELTVSETYLFRNIEQFRALAEVALPARMAARSEARRLRILSAGCASGDEAYSIAMVVRDFSALTGWDVSIQAVDLNPAMIEKAIQGRYSPWSFREAPADIQSRFFSADGKNFALTPTVRSMVTFLHKNLAEDDHALWPRDTLDVVFCRNVLMYFTAEAARGVVERISRSLSPGGFLFLGHAETLRGLSRDFHLEHSHGTFYYRRKDSRDLGGTLREDPHVPDPYQKRAERDPSPSSIAADDSWVESIRRASERVRSLTTAPSGSDEPVPGLRAARTPEEEAPADLVGAIDLLRREQYLEALALLGRLPTDRASHPDALLLRAVLLTQAGDLAGAEEVCRQLLEQDEMNAGAHYLMALCRDDAGQTPSAADHDRLAAYLDPGFAMPRLHLGLLARRAGDRSRARRELEGALVLLEDEEDSRLLLFGGGFSRETLRSLCRAEIARCEAAP